MRHVFDEAIATTLASASVFINLGALGALENNLGLAHDTFAFRSSLLLLFLGVLAISGILFLGQWLANALLDILRKSHDSFTCQLFEFFGANVLGNVS